MGHRQSRPTEKARASTALVILHEPQVGGASRSVLRAAALLAEQGWRSVFWAPKPSPLFNELRSQGLDVEGAPRYIDFGLRSLAVAPGPRQRLAALRPYLRALRAFASELQPAVVHANSVTTLVDGLALRAEFPVLLHVHEMVPGGLRGRMIRETAWRRLGQVVAASEACAETMMLNGIRPRVVYEAAPTPPEPLPLRDCASPFVVGSVGVVSRRKGSDTFVAAARLVRERGHRVDFELIGAPTDERDRRWGERVIDEAVAAGVEHSAWADVPERFARWDVFVLPSRQDPFPIVMLEAMAHGLPVIGTRVDGITEQIAPGCGVLVPGDDPRALADAIVAMSQASFAERATMASAARDRVLRHFTIKHQAAGLAEAYRAAIAAHGR